MAALLIDAGNTRIKWGLTDASGSIVERGSLLTVDAGSLNAALAEQCRIADRAIFVSVAGDEVNHSLAQTLNGLVSRRWWRFESVPQISDLRNDYANPVQLGADRLAAALGAWRRTGTDCLVVNCGTATTIDIVERGDNLQKIAADAALSVGARFVGGVILPGLSLMKSSLFRDTARLPNAAGKLTAIPDNTDDAIESGCLLAQIGAVEAMWRRCSPTVPVILSGGAATDLRPHLDARGMAVIEAPELVLEGLAVAILQRFQ